MESNAPPRPTMTYRLTCTDCPFETVVDVDVDTVFDVIEEHQTEYEADRSEHLVDFERITDVAES